MISGHFNPGDSSAAHFHHGDKHIAFFGTFDSPQAFYYFAHEVGHAVEEKYPKILTLWEDAIARDGNHVSEYGHSNSSEDFAEFFATYVIHGGSTEELRRLYPHRCAILDHILNTIK